MEKNKVLILASGGMDSSVLVALYSHLNYDVHCMYVKYGNKNAYQELNTLIALCDKFRVPKSNRHESYIGASFNASSITGNGTDPYVCMRNLILASMAISKAEELDIPEVVLGFINVPSPYKDADDYFIANLNKLSSESCGVTVKAPLIGMTKQQAYDFGKSMGLSMGDIFSCFSPNEDGSPCGKCYGCLDLAQIEK